MVFDYSHLFEILSAISEPHASKSNFFFVAYFETEPSPGRAYHA